MLSALGIHKPDHEVVRILTRNRLHEVYDGEQHPRMLCHGIMRSEMEQFVRTSHANRKTKTLEDRKLAAVVSTVASPLADPYALAVGGVFQQQQRQYGGAGPQHQQQRQYGDSGPQQQQQRQHGGAGLLQQQQRQYEGAGPPPPQQQQQRQHGGAGPQQQQRHY